MGGFGLSDPLEVLPFVAKHFDVACWPELLGLGVQEELVPFWTAAFLKWESASQEERGIAGRELLERPGFQAFLKFFQDASLPTIKGQMIGPATLLWALRKRDSAPKDLAKVIEFVAQAYQFQVEHLSPLASRVVVSLDEPCAFLVSEAGTMWEEVLSVIRYRQYHEGATALHCCGTPEAQWLSYDWDVVHFDFFELVGTMERNPHLWKDQWKQFFSEGRWFAAGLFSDTELSKMVSSEDRSTTIVEELSRWSEVIDFQQLMVSSSCGLSAKSADQLAKSLERLEEVQELVQRNFL